MPSEELHVEQEETLPESHGPFEIDLSDDPKHPQWRSNPHHLNDVFYASRKKHVASEIRKVLTGRGA